MRTLPTPRRRQRGISLIESLVALLVAALGILGVVGVQMRTLADTQTGLRRAQAIRLIEDLSERTRVNPNALASISSYASAMGGAPDTVPSCADGCDIAALAARDVADWKQAVAQQLPGGQAAIFVAPSEATGNERQLGVLIAWRENERADADADYLAAIDTGSSDCPTDEGFTCHLQYIPVGARCAINDNNQGVRCPGA